MSSRYSHNIGVHQRDLRTQLFSSPTGAFQKPAAKPERVGSPYEKAPSQSAKHNEAYLLSLESQNNEDIDGMGQRIAMMKDLSVRMGTEINKSIKLNDNITDNFEKGKVTLKNTYNKMVIMSERAGISCKTWFIVFGVVVMFFLWVWMV